MISSSQLLWKSAASWPIGVTCSWMPLRPIGLADLAPGVGDHVADGCGGRRLAASAGARRRGGVVAAGRRCAAGAAGARSVGGRACGSVRRCRCEPGRGQGDRHPISLIFTPVGHANGKRGLARARFARPL